MAEPASTYIFDNSDEREGARLAGIQAAFDPGTFRHLTDLGVAPGWRCLEVGAGAGSVARWLCQQVGEQGSVLATDIDTTLLDGIDLPNLEVRRHDLQTEDLPEGAFDLVHTRLVLIHLPAREEILRRLAAALAPGGWLLVEDITMGGAGSATHRGQATFRGVIAALLAVFKAYGADVNFARRLPLLMNRLGLVDVGAEGRVPILIGDTESIDWALPTFDVLQARLVGDDGPGSTKARAAFERVPALRCLLDAQLSRLRNLLADPGFVFHGPTMVAAWGRKPPA
jgi:SAM-dependent methyltransferase